MRFTVTGSLGNISKPLVEILVKAGHDVTVISSSEDRKEAIEALGAKAAVGSVSDEFFLTKAFRGADAIYTMVPPNFGVANYRQYMQETGNIYAAAIKSSGVKRVANLSSIGAHLSSGTGPISGLYDVENSLNALEDVAVVHLRAGFFYVNFFNDITLIRNNSIMGSNYAADANMPMVHPKDIATAAAEAMQGSIEGKSYRYVVSDERQPTDVAKILGTAIGKPELPWVQVTDEQLLEGMLGAGMPKAIATTYVEMGNAVQKGLLLEDYKAQDARPTGHTSLEDFARDFAAVYNS